MAGREAAGHRAGSAREGDLTLAPIGPDHDSEPNPDLTQNPKVNPSITLDLHFDHPP